MVPLAHVVGSPEFYWAIVAEVSILLCTALLFIAPRWSRRRGHHWRFRLVAFGGALLASGITLIGKLVEVWPGHPLFPSGHAAYAVAVGAFLVVLDVRWLPVTVPLLLLLGVALILSHYHVAADIAGGAVVGLLVAGALGRSIPGTGVGRPGRPTR